MVTEPTRNIFLNIISLVLNIKVLFYKIKLFILDTLTIRSGIDCLRFRVGFLDKMGNKNDKKSKHRHSSRRHRENRNRDRSSSTDSCRSANSDSTSLRKQFKFLQKEVNDLRNFSSTSAGICVSDEQAIPIFDFSKDDIMVEMWEMKVDILAERYKVEWWIYHKDYLQQTSRTRPSVVPRTNEKWRFVTWNENRNIRPFP